MVRPNFLKRMVRGVAFLCTLGAGVAVTTVLASLSTFGAAGGAAKLGGAVGSVILNIGLFVLAFRITTPSDEGLPPVANLLAIAPAETGKPFLYYLGAGWSKSGDFPEETDWENYVRQFVARLRAPLRVTLENE